MTNRRPVTVLLCLAAGSIAVAAGLYFGRFIALGAGSLVVMGASGQGASLNAISLITGIAWWAFMGLIAAPSLGYSALSKPHRLRFVWMTILGFALGGLLAALLGQAGIAGRDTLLSNAAVPLGGALAGLLMGFGARLGVRAAILAIALAVAMLIARPLLALIPPSDLVVLLAPGAIAGATLAALTPG